MVGRLRRPIEFDGVEPMLREMLAYDNGEMGAVFAITGTVAYTDTTAKTLFVLPAKTLVVAVHVDVTTAFNDSGTDVLDVGKVGTGNHFRNDLDVSSAGQTLTGWSNLGDVGASAVGVTATYAGQNANASAGAARVTFVCLQPL